MTMTKDDEFDDDSPFDGLDVDTSSDLPVHEEFVSDKKARVVKAKKNRKGAAGLNIRKF
jgi:hypothetical protein